MVSYSDQLKKYLNQKLWLSQQLLEDQDLVKNNEGYYLFFSKSFKIELAVKVGYKSKKKNQTFEPKL